ncbi:MAG: DUF11 domain-containing protein [Candidatus Kerfeldbacteria bacterium]|nr:DUF11 domain-containing protein [Candidatus Kerfeldbacteria bacterium]
MLKKLSRYAERGLHIFVLLTMLTYTAGFGLFFNAPMARAAQAAANLDQCRNGSAASHQNCIDSTWVNGNAGEANSHYVEGESIPYRAVLTGLPTATPITITFGYDIKHSDRHAIDYLTQYDRTDVSVNPINDIPAASGLPNTFAIPAPSSVGSPVAGQPTNSFNNLPAAERVMSIWNGTISSMNYVTEGVLTASNSETRIAITFTATNSTVVLSWGGHIGSRLDWGYDVSNVPLSAGGISGSPYHMRLIGWSLSNLGNQDRSLSAGAVAPPANIIIEKQTLPDGSTEQFAFTGDIAGTISDNGQLTASLPAGTYSVTESVKTNWSLTSLVCDDTDSVENVGTRTATINVSSGESLKCTFTNTRDTGDLKVVKLNQNQQPMAGVDFTIAGEPYSTDANGEILITDLETGDYSAEEIVPNNYTLTSVSGTNCTNANPSTATVVKDQTTTCTFTNTRDTGTIKVNKEVDTNGDGTFDGGNTEAASLGFVWGIDAESPARAMGSSETVVTGNYDINENSVTNYHLSGWYTNGSDYSCENPESTTLPANIDITKDSTTEITLCNTRDTGIITFEKIVNGDALVSRWIFTIDGVLGSWMSGDSVTLPTGSYTVFESGPDGYTNTDVSGVCSPSTPGQGLLTVDTNGGTCTFTNTRDTGTITGLKFNDLNGNGSLDAGEPGVPGVTINLSDGQTTTTDANGQFSFNDVPTGNYDVDEIVPTGWMNTTQTSVNLDVTKDEQAYAEFGNFKKVNITVCKALDADGDDQTTDDQTLKDGWSIYLAKDGKAVDQGQVTGQDGCYTWADMGPGSYEAAEATPDNWIPLYDDGTHNFGTVTSGETYTHTFVNTRERGEVTINKEIRNPQNGSAVPSDWTFTLHPTQGGDDITGINHNTPINIPTGFYTVSESGPSQYSFLYAYGDCNEDGDIYLEITSEGATCTFVNETYAVHGQKWNDANGNGIWDQDETALNGWNISIYQNDELIDSILTQTHNYVDGWYWFNDLAAGSYEICETPQAGWVQTYPTANNGCHTISVPIEITYEQQIPQIDNSTCSLNFSRELRITAVENSIVSEALCNFGNTPEVVVLGIAKINDQEVAQGGNGLLETTETITYRVDWNVDGNSNATDVVLTDIIPAELNLNVASISDSGVWNAATRTITWNFGTQAPGASGFVTYEATLKVPASDGDIIINVARLSASNTDPTFVEADSPVEVNVPVVLGEEALPALTIEKTVNKAFANPGDTVTYTIVVTNTGDAVAEGVTVIDTLPDGLHYTDTMAMDHSWFLGDILDGESKTITYQVTVNANAIAGNYINTAVAWAAGVNNVTDTATLEVRKPAVLGAEDLPVTGAGFLTLAFSALAGFGAVVLSKRKRK